MTDMLLQNREFLQTLLESIPSMLFVVDSDVRIFELNSAASSFAGREENDMLRRRGGEALRCVHAGKDLDRCGEGEACRDCVIRNSVRKSLEGKQIIRETTTLSLVAGAGMNVAHFKITTSPLTFGDNIFVLLVIDDVTELKNAEDALRESEARLYNITSVIGEGLYVVDALGRLTFMNPEAERLLGWSEEELLGIQASETFHYRTADGTRLPESGCPALMTIKSGSICRDENILFTRKDGTVFPAAVVATPLREQDRIVGSVTVFQDITERKKEAEELQRLNDLLSIQASTDPLTGIANRLKFNDTLAVEIKRSKRYGLPLSLIMFDIDRFKSINDTYGHHAGDAVLSDLAELIEKNIRGHDLFARWGGEEFMIMAGNSDADHAGILAEKLRRLVERHAFPDVGRVTCSFGVTGFSPGESADRLRQRADYALYRAKAQGRNRVERA